MKKLLARLLPLILCMNLLLICIPSVSADTAAENLPEKTVIVKPGATAETTTVSFADKVYNVTFGTDCFDTLGGARDACPAGGTILLCPGEYTGNFAFGRDVTIKGPLAGVDPNVRGAKKDDDWTLNPLRKPDDPTVEAVIKGQIWPGFSNADTILNEDMHLTIDGVVFGGSGFIRSTNFAQAKETITVKNVIAYKTSGYSLVHTVASSWAYNADINLCQRYLTFENIRAIDVGYSLFGSISAESFLAKGVYVDEETEANAVTGLFVTAAAAGTAPVSFTFEDSMFRLRDTTNKRVLSLGARSNAYNNYNVDIGKKESVTATIDGCVFLNCGVGDGKAILAQFNTDNLHFVFKNNIFKQVGEAIGGYHAFEDYCNLSEYLAMGDNYIIENNTFDNVPFTAKLLYSSDEIELTKNLSIAADGSVTVPVVWPNDPEGTENPKTYKAKIVSYYTDLEKTNLKQADGSGPVINPEDLKTVIKSIPDNLFTEPEAGKAPSRDANVPSDASYSASSVKWYDASNNQTYTIKGGSSYTAVVTLTSGSTMTSFKEGETQIPSNYTVEFGEDGKTLLVKQTFAVEAGEEDVTTSTEEEAVTTTAAIDTPVTTPEPGTEAPEPEQPSGGCSSVAGIGAVILVTILGSAILKKKH